VDHPVREYRFTYTSDPYNGVSLMQKLDIIGFDDDRKAYDSDNPADPHAKQLPPLTFGYTRFDPERQCFRVVEGCDLPAHALNAPDLELVDLHGSGLPDILQMNGVVRYWRNLGNGRYDLPRLMPEAPPHSLADPGVQMIDANGDGRMDLLVSGGPLAGYYPLTFNARWDLKSFQENILRGPVDKDAVICSEHGYPPVGSSEINLPAKVGFVDMFARPTTKKPTAKSRFVTAMPQVIAIPSGVKAATNTKIALMKNPTPFPRKIASRALDASALRENQSTTPKPMSRPPAARMIFSE
jgi:hypothetical protein